MSVAKHTPGPVAETIACADAWARVAQIATYSDLRDISAQAEEFTELVERFFRGGDGTDDRAPATETEVAEAMYALRAAIAKATWSAA
jgi:hypothetical protein